MVSKQVQKREHIYKNLQSLRSISNSPAQSKRSIILDAVKYIQELKQKVEEMNHEMVAATAQIPTTTTTTAQSSFHVQVKVEAREEEEDEAAPAGFEIKIFTEKSGCSGLLVFVLEAFEELGLDVLQARVSCSDNFLLEAVVATINNNNVSIDHRYDHHQQQDGRHNQKDAEVVREAMLQAIRSWTQVSQL